MDQTHDTGSDTCSPDQQIDVKSLRGTLFKAAADAGKSLRLSPVEQAALSALIVCVNVRSVRNNHTISVPASSQQLEDLTGFSPSSLDAALRSLAERGLIRRVASRSHRRFEVDCAEIGYGAVYGFDLAPLQSKADELRAGARQVDAERRWLRELRHQINCLSAKVRKELDILQGHSGREKESAAAPLINEHDALLKHGASRSLSLNQAKALVDAWTGLAARVDGHNSTMAATIEGISAEPLPSSALGGEEAVSTSHAREATALDDGRIFALVNGNLPIVAETVGQPIADLTDLTASAAMLALMTGVGLETWVKVQQDHGPLKGALVLSYFAQIREEDVTSGRWKIKSPRAYLLSLSERVRERDDIIGWIEGLRRRTTH
ncbi:helix-turn-helix domain-containing protein [Microvirga lotononidis]|nr:helix-turn-helix domain-containing protein [Microvirga lotononidis]WQO30374.1 helix-turn-helix domain-containing protein [Microvirga lotononidis]